MTAAARTATDIVRLCENSLGWMPDEKHPLWKARAIEAGKLNKAMKRDPKRVTFTNLELAIEYSRKNKLPIKSPVGLIYRIDRALEEAPVEEEIGEVQAAIEAAVAHELGAQRFGYEAWVERLMRSRGAYRREVLKEWKEAGRSG